MRHEIGSRAWYGWLALGIVAFLLAATPAASVPIHYDISFTLGAGSPLPTAGGFDYDAALPAFSNFVVEWNGHTFDLTTVANTPAETGGTAFSTSCGLAGAALSFALLSKASCIVQAADGFGPGWVADEVADSGASLFQFLASGGGPSDLTELSVTEIVSVASSESAGGSGDFQISARVPGPPTAALIAVCLAAFAGLAGRRRRPTRSRTGRPWPSPR